MANQQSRMAPSSAASSTWIRRRIASPTSNRSPVAAKRPGSRHTSRARAPRVVALSASPPS